MSSCEQKSDDPDAESAALPTLADVQAILRSCAPQRPRDIVKALQSRFPARDWSLVKTSAVWTTRVSALAPDGAVVVADADKWIERQSLDRSAVQALIAGMREQDVRFKKTEKIIYQIVGTIGTDPVDFMQFRLSLDTDVVCPVRDVDSWYIPELAGGLSTKWELAARSSPTFVAHDDGMLNSAEWRERCNESWKQQRESELQRLERIVTRRQLESSELGPAVPYLQSHPLPEGWLDEPAKEERWFRDWQRSSAGNSNMGRHWWLDPRDFIDDHGTRVIGFIPRPIAWPKAKIKAKRKTCVRLMDELARLDRRVGHPFAWFFHMVYGNRVSDFVGETIADGIRRGDVHLPASDETVLLDWVERPYGF